MLLTMNIEHTAHSEHLPLIAIGLPGESHREQAQDAAIAAHTFARVIPAGRLHARTWGLDATALEAEVGL